MGDDNVELLRWAIFCAAMVEWLCWQDGLQFPTWPSHTESRLTDPWFLYPGDLLRAWQLVSTPAPFKMRQERGRNGKPWTIEPNLSHGLGARLDALCRTEKREQLLLMALGVFSSAGVVRLRLQREGDVSNVGDLLVYSLDELEAIAAEKGGVRQLLDEKWRKVYKASAPRGIFTRDEMRAA